MPETRTDWLIFAVGMAAVGLLVAAIVLNPHHSRPAASAEPVVRSPATTPAPALHTISTQPTPPIAPPAPASATATKRTLRPSRFTVTAVRGSSWVSIRVGSPTGRVLFAGILQPRRAVTVTGKRCYLGFGAAANVDVAVDGRRVAGLPSGTSAVVISSDGRWATTAYVG